MNPLLGSRTIRSVFALALGIAPVAFAGCSEPTPAVPRVVFESTLGGGTGQTSCQIATANWFSVGNFGNPDNGIPSRPVESGEAEGQGTVSVDCKVVPEGSGFRVVASASNSGATGGTFTINGLFTTEGEQTDVKAVFYRDDYGRFTQEDCTVTYPEAATRETPVAAGRVWGEIVCNAAENKPQDRICTAKAQFRFENCNQN